MTEPQTFHYLQDIEIVEIYPQAKMSDGTVKTIDVILLTMIHLTLMQCETLVHLVGSDLI